MNFIEAVKKAKEGKRVYRKYSHGIIHLYAVYGVWVSFGENKDKSILTREDVLSEDWEVEG